MSGPCHAKLGGSADWARCRRGGGSIVESQLRLDCQWLMAFGWRRKRCGASDKEPTVTDSTIRASNGKKTGRVQRETVETPLRGRPPWCANGRSQATIRDQTREANRIHRVPKEEKAKKSEPPGLGVPKAGVPAMWSTLCSTRQRHRAECTVGMQPNLRDVIGRHLVDAVLVRDGYMEPPYAAVPLEEADHGHLPPADLHRPLL
jgi:hypothetical protein